MTTGRNHPVRRWVFSISLVALLFCGLGATDNSPEPQKSDDAKTQHPPFEAFHILIERNIFGTKNQSAPDTAQNAPNANPYAHTIRLMGTWIEGERAQALFEENPGNLCRILEPGQSIAEYVVQTICTNTVVLHNGQGDVELPVGAGLGQNDAGQWTLTEHVSPAQLPKKTGTTSQTAPAQAITIDNGQQSGTAKKTGFRRGRKQPRHAPKELES
jgi:hypothetical protein